MFHSLIPLKNVQIFKLHMYVKNTHFDRFEAEHKVVVQVFEECLAVGFNESPAYLEVGTRLMET